MNQRISGSKTDRGDGKRPDGITTFPFSKGKCLVWDATCGDTFSQSSIIGSALSACFVAKAAEESKRKKYQSLADRFLFYPIAVETSGTIGPASLSLLQLIAKRISSLSGDNRELPWLLQRISLFLVRGNSLEIISASRMNSQLLPQLLFV